MRNPQQAEWDARRPFNAPASSAARNTGHGLPAPVPARPFSTPAPPTDPLIDNGRPRESPYPDFTVPKIFGESFPHPPSPALDTSLLTVSNTSIAPTSSSPFGDQRGPARPQPARPGTLSLMPRGRLQEF